MVEIGTGNSCVLLLEYDQNGVPDGGMEVYSQLRGLSKSYGKDAAGHVFHYKALIQAGVIQGEMLLANSCLYVNNMHVHVLLAGSQVEK